MVVFIVSLLIGWTAFLLGAIKWLLNRQLIGIETRVEASEKKTAELTTAQTTMRLEFSQKATCSNHARMEENDTRLFKRLDQLHGDIRELCGKVGAVVNSLDLLNQHHLNGSK
jgi:hypothetical protein